MVRNDRQECAGTRLANGASEAFHCSEERGDYVQPVGDEVA
jgi:hypothetical protein